MREERFVLCLIVCGVLLAGCHSGQLPLVPVKGRVTFDGAAPPASGMISFMMVPGTGLKNVPVRSGSATFGTDGRFEVSTFKNKDGLLPGKYEVKIVCWVGTPTERDPSSYIELDRVPQDFRPELVVKEDSEPVEVTFDVPPKKEKS